MLMATCNNHGFAEEATEMNTASRGQASVSEPIVLNAEQVAQTLGVSVRTIRRLDCAGKLPKPVRIGGAVRWRRDELEAWVAADCPDREKWEPMRYKAAI
jgi:prophage regulatory protein